MVPSKLKKGDQIRIITPARSMAMPWIQAVKQDAEKKLRSMGFSVTYGKHVMERDEFDSSPVASRIADLHDAFRDEKVKAILTVIGGYNSNQLLAELDYELIKKNPKILCGYSDITALANAIYAKTDLVTYSGPHFFTFGERDGLPYTADYFKKCLMNEEAFDVEPSTKWSDDRWAGNDAPRTFMENEGWWIINEGTAEGTIVGANLCTFNLLQGTAYMPPLAGTVIFLEDDYESLPHHFDRDLQSVLQLKDFSGVKGLVIGRFQKKTGMSKELLTKIIKTKKELAKLPVIANVDFGHTYPMITFPIGGKVSIEAKEKASIKITEH